MVNFWLAAFQSMETTRKVGLNYVRVKFVEKMFFTTVAFTYYAIKHVYVYTTD